MFSHLDIFVQMFPFSLCRFYTTPYSLAPNRMIAQTALSPYLPSPVSSYQVGAWPFLTRPTGGKGSLRVVATQRDQAKEVPVEEGGERRWTLPLSIPTKEGMSLFRLLHHPRQPRSLHNPVLGSQ